MCNIDPSKSRRRLTHRCGKSRARKARVRTTMNVNGTNGGFIIQVKRRRRNTGARLINGLPKDLAQIYVCPYRAQRSRGDL